jgi:hypothetical protein
MAAFYILVMDQYKDDPDKWISSVSSSSIDKLQNMSCYNDPPLSLPRATFIAVSQERLNKPIPPCKQQDGNAEGGTIYGIHHV